MTAANQPMLPDLAKSQQMNGGPGTEENLAESCRNMAVKARAASRVLAMIPTAQKNTWLHQTASYLDIRVQETLEANALDLSEAAASGHSKASLDRLKLTPERIRSAVAGVIEEGETPHPRGGAF